MARSELFSEPMEIWTSDRLLENWAAAHARTHFGQWARGVNPRFVPEIPTGSLLQLKTWFNQLGDDERNSLLNQLEAFCSRTAYGRQIWLGFTETPLSQRLGKLLLYFTMAAYLRQSSRAAQMIFRYLSGSRSNKDKEFGWSLFTLLVESGECNVPGELLLEGKRQRQHLVREVIRDAYRTNPSIVILLAREVLFINTLANVSTPPGKGLIKI